MEQDHERLSVLPLKASSGVLFKVLGTFRLQFLSRGKGCSATDQICQPIYCITYLISGSCHLKVNHEIH